MTHPVLAAEDATSAVTAALAGLARAHADSPSEVQAALQQLAEADKLTLQDPEQADTLRSLATQELIKLARRPRVHRFSDDTADAYDATQCREDILDGDVLVVESEGVVGFLNRAWPIALTKAHGEFHRLKVSPDLLLDGRYTASVERAEQIAAELGFELVFTRKPAGDCEHCSCWANHANGLLCCRGCGTPGHAMTGQPAHGS